MERPYLDKWKLYLLSEAKGPEKPPYFKNIYGSTNNVTKANAKEVAQTMSRILKQTVTIFIPTDFESYSEDFRACNNSKGEFIYIEYDRLGKQYWQRRNYSKENYYMWGTDGSEKTVNDYDKDWIYLRTALVDDGMKKKYWVAKRNNALIQMNSQLMKPQSSGDAYVELRPGTKAYEAVKRDVFKD